MDEENKHKCFRCKYFDCYYIKGAKRFNKIKFGKCGKNGKTVGIHEACESFKGMPKPKPDRKTINYNLYELLREVSTIRNLIEEQISENKDL